MQGSESWTAARARAYAAIMTCVLAAGASAACSRDAGDTGAAAASSTPADGVAYGDAIPLGDGAARGYVKLVAGEPVEIGIALSETSFNNLPDHNSPGGETMPDGMKTFMFDVPLPATNTTAYQHAMLDWNPGGHEPPGIYTVPHFDFHFYTIPQAEREAILPTDPKFAEKAAHFPPAERLPAGYFAPAPNAVPQMGVHWLDPKTPELNGQPFDKTFLYGTFDGKLIFAEPMVTKAFLESRPNFTAPIALPQAYAAPGMYATSYTIRWDDTAREYQIALGGLQPVERRDGDGMG